ncbi:Uncharacterized protein PCOAH_00029950 [Plasmodium coatneyi]|uniref:Transcription factor with AP2 domain(S) n=1 Tax=Plasmodium coatneyi TaxID=208452 RepID=A0A1B1E0U6_9APIC|nr:Uncharacterized protein PCOAH_00029950 [Plasmodium coatneyi]ANQ08590.1 Uncharacterized protein PCOAH_00029950 [Plasmodium coatneyi]
METEEGDILADVGPDVPVNGGGGKGDREEESGIGAINEVFFQVNQINPIDDVSALASPGKTPHGEEISGENGTTPTGGIKIGINKKDYDLYISQMKDKGAKDVAKNNGGEMRRNNDEGKNNECDSYYYDEKHLDGNTTEFLDDGDASNKRTINTIISRMDSDLTNTEDALSKVNDNSTTYMSNENNICFLNNEADITDHSNYNPHFQFDEMVDPTDKPNYLENCDHLNFFKNGETDEMGLKNGGECKADQESAFHEDGSEHKCGNLVEEIFTPEMNNPMPLNIDQPFGGNEQESEEDKLLNRVNPNFCDQPHLSELQEVVHNDYAFLENEEITSKLSTFCSKIQNDGEATSGKSPLYQPDDQVTIEPEDNLQDKAALLATSHLYEQKDSHQSDPSAGGHMYLDRGNEQEEEDGEEYELLNHLREKNKNKRKENDEEEMHNDSKGKEFLFQEEKNNVDVSTDYPHLYEECLRMSDGEDPSGCTIRRIRDSNGSNVACSSGETLSSNVALNSGGEKDAENHGRQEETPPQEGVQTDHLYDQTFGAVKKVGRRAGRKSKNSANKSGELNGDTRGRGRFSLKPSDGCDVDATGDCEPDEDHMDDPNRDYSKENIEEEQSNGNDGGRAKHGSTNGTYARRPLRNAAKKCINLWSEELKKKSEKHNAALERSKNMSDQRKEERALRRKEKVIKNGAKVMLRGGLAKGYGGRGWARGETKRETKFDQDDSNGIYPAEGEEAKYEQEEEVAEEGAEGGEGVEGVNGKVYSEEGQEGTHRRARGRPPQRTGSHTDPKVRERNQGNEAYGSGQIKSDQLANDANERGTKGGRKKNDLSSLGQDQENIPILFNDSMDEREMFKYLDLLRHLPSKKGGAQYKLHKAILTEEMVRRAKKFPLVQGVYFDRYQQRWSVNWNEDGKRVAKYFPIKLFGFDYARRLAIYCKNYQKIPEEALIFEQAYRASQQSNKHRNDHSEGVNGVTRGGINVGVTENGSGNGSGNASANGSINGGGKLRRGGPKRGYKKRGLRKQDNSNEDKSTSGYGKRRKNIKTYQSGEMDSTMDGSGNLGPGQISSTSNYPLCSNYSGSANSGTNSSERKDSNYRSDGGAKMSSYFPGGSLPGSQKVGENYSSGLNRQYSQNNQHTLHSIWGVLEILTRHPHQTMVIKTNNGRSANQAGEESNSVNPSTGHVKKEQKNSTGTDANADRTDMENMMRVRQRMMMLEQGKAANANKYMPFGNATVGYPIGESSNEMRRFGSGDIHLDGEKNNSCMHNMVSSVGPVNSNNPLPMSTHFNHPNGANDAVENGREFSSGNLPHMMRKNSTVEKGEKKRGRKKGQLKKNHFVCTSTGTSSFKSSSSHISSTSSCYKNVEMYLSSNGPLHDMGEAHRWRKGDPTSDVPNMADVADAARASSYNDERGSYYTTNGEAEKGDVPTLQGVQEDKISTANMMENRGDDNSERFYLHAGREPSGMEEEPDEIDDDEEEEDEADDDADEGEDVNPGEYAPRGRGIIRHAVRNIMPNEDNIDKGVTHLNSVDGVSEVAGDDVGRSIFPHGVVTSTVVDGDQTEAQIENDGNEMEDIRNISKYSEIVNRLDNYNLISRMNQVGVKVEGELIHLGGVHLKRENTEGASKDSIKEEINDIREEDTMGEMAPDANIMNEGDVPNEDILNGGELTQENNEDDINSRIVGVHYDRKQYRWKATWYTSHGRRCAKYYPIKQYGYLEAKKMAIECRRAYNAYKKLKKDPENGIEEGEFNFDSTIFPKEYYITLFENDEKKDGYFWNPKKNKKTGKKSPFLDNNEKQRRHYNEALKKITNIKYKDLSQLNEFMVRKNDGEASTYASMGTVVDPVEGCNVFTLPLHQQEEDEDYSVAQLEMAGMGAYPGGSYLSEGFQASQPPLAMTTPEVDSTAPIPVRNVDGATPPIMENEQNEEWSTLQGVYNEGGIFQDSCCNVMNEEGQQVASNGCSAQNVSSLLSLYYLSENILKFQKGTIKCILQDLRDNCLSNLAYDIKNITFQEYYMAIHYLNRYVEDSNCYDDIFFLLKILAKNLEIRKIPSLYNEEEQKELLNSLTVITKQMKSGYSYFTPDPVRSSPSEGGETAAGMSPSDRFSSIIFQ